MTRQWWIALAVGTAAGAFAACSSSDVGTSSNAVKPDDPGNGPPGLAIEITPSGEAETCPSEVCFRATATKDVGTEVQNITHVFVNPDCPEAADIDISITNAETGEPIEPVTLRDLAGTASCRDAEGQRSNVPGPASDIIVCLTSNDVAFGDIPVVVKAASLCQEATISANGRECVECGTGGTGGVGGTGGTGGTGGVGGTGGELPGTGGTGGECPPPKPPKG